MKSLWQKIIHAGSWYIAKTRHPAFGALPAIQKGHRLEDERWRRAGAAGGQATVAQGFKRLIKRQGEFS